MAIIRDYSISDYFEQQQHRNSIDQTNQQFPGELLPENIIRSECALVNTAVFRDHLDRPVAALISDPEFQQLAFGKLLIWQDGKMIAAIAPLEDFGRPGANAAIAVEEQIIFPSLDHSFRPRWTVIAEPSATKADVGFSKRD